MSAIEAIAEVVRSLGFDTLAREFMERPEYRARIATIAQRQIAKIDPAKAQRFGLLCRETLAHR